MRKILYIILALALGVTACKKDDEPEIKTTETIDSTDSKNSHRCKISEIEFHTIEKYPMGSYKFIQLERLLFYDYKPGLDYIFLYEQLGDKVWKQTPELGTGNYSVLYYDNDNKLVKKELFDENGINTGETHYNYNCGFTSWDGKEYCLIKDITTGEYSTQYHYTGNKLDSVTNRRDSAGVTVFENTIVKYNYKSEYVRKADITDSYNLATYVYYEEYLNPQMQVIKIDEFLYNGNYIGHVLYNYDCD